MCARTHGALVCSCAVFATVACLVAAAAGQTRSAEDESAHGAIARARDELYLYMQFEAAESLLLETIRDCAERCSPSTVAEAWMYVGIVRSTPGEDLVGAREAFSRARDADPDVKLDRDLAAERSNVLWKEVKAHVDRAPEDPSPSWAFECTPTILQSQTGRRIPISCPAADGAERMVVRYREWGDQGWKSVAMRRVGDHFRVILPCSATRNSGPLRFFVEEKSPAGDVTGSYGTSRRPIELIVSDESTVVPAFPGSPPPELCDAPIECPPGLADCVREGGRCEETQECKQDLVCVRKNGSPRKICRKAETCESDDDCDPGKCERGVCVPDGEPGKTDRHRSWLGLEVGLDLVLLPEGSGVCTRQAQAASDPTYRCFRGDSAYPDGGNEPVDASAAGQVRSGFGLGTVRLLVSYDHALGSTVTLGGRGGVALGGAPRGFLPVHAEGRLSYWFGRNPFASGVRPHVFAGLGWAEVGAPVAVYVQNRNLATDQVSRHSVDAWADFGPLFFAGGGGLSFVLTDALTAKVDLAAMVTFPTSTVVLEPTGGVLLAL